MNQKKYPHDWELYFWFGGFLILSGILHYLVFILYCVCEGHHFRELDPYPRLLMTYPMGSLVYFCLGILSGFLNQLESILKKTQWLFYLSRFIKALSILGICIILIQILRIEYDLFIVLFGGYLW